MNSSPGFSIIVPTFNRVESLVNTLLGIALLDYPRDKFQVIVVNDGGAAVPLATMRQFESKLQLCVLNQENGGPSVARNAGAAQAQHEWLVFTDDDCVPDANWLRHLAEAVQPNLVLGGTTENGLDENVYAEASQCLIFFLYSYYHQSSRRRTQLPYFASNNLAMPWTAFDAVGGFNESMRWAEDRDLCARLATAGFSLKFVPEARIRHYRAMDLRSYWRQHVSYGRGAFHYHENLKRTGKHSFRLESSSFYLDLFRYPWRYRATKRGRLLSLLLLGQAANVVGFVGARARAKPS